MPATNVLEWEFTDSQGNVLHEATLVDETRWPSVSTCPSRTHFSVLHTNDSVFHNGSPYPWRAWSKTTSSGRRRIIPGTFQGRGPSAEVAGSMSAAPSWNTVVAPTHRPATTTPVPPSRTAPAPISWPDAWAAGCPEANNYGAIVDDGSCAWPSCANCPADINGDDAVTVSDVLPARCLRHHLLGFSPSSGAGTRRGFRIHRRPPVHDLQCRWNLRQH